MSKEPSSFKARALQAKACVALDGTGGDVRDTQAVVEAVRFAMAMYPSLYLIVFGSSQLQSDLKREKVDLNRYEFRLAQQCIPQDEAVRSVLTNYTHSAMAKAIQCVRDGEANAVLSSGGTGPLVTLARHLLGVQHLSEAQAKLKAKALHGRCKTAVRPCFAARIPVGPQRYALMLDLGANASCECGDLFDFACLGNAAAKISLSLEQPRVALLNIGSELGKGDLLVQQTRVLLEQDRSLLYTGYIEANRIFCDDADVIVTDGFTGNVALKAAEGVAALYAGAGGIKRILGKMARPDWLLPWQYSGSLLLGVNGIVVKAHASAGKEALAVAMVEAARAASLDLAVELQRSLDLFKA